MSKTNLKFELNKNVLSIPGFKVGSIIDQDVVLRAYGLDQNHELATVKYDNGKYKLEISFRTQGEQRHIELTNDNLESDEVQDILDYANKNKLTNLAKLKKFAELCNEDVLSFGNNCWIEGLVKLTYKKSKEVVVDDWESNLGMEGVYGSLKDVMSSFIGEDMDKYIDYLLDCEMECCIDDQEEENSICKKCGKIL